MIELALAQNTLNTLNIIETKLKKRELAEDIEAVTEKAAQDVIKCVSAQDLQIYLDAHPTDNLAREIELQQLDLEPFEEITQKLSSQKSFSQDEVEHIFSTIKDAEVYPKEDILLETARRLVEVIPSEQLANYLASPPQGEHSPFESIVSNLITKDDMIFELIEKSIGFEHLKTLVGKSPPDKAGFMELLFVRKTLSPTLARITCTETRQKVLKHFF